MSLHRSLSSWSDFETAWKSVEELKEELYRTEVKLRHAAKPFAVSSRKDGHSRSSTTFTSFLQDPGGSARKRRRKVSRKYQHDLVPVREVSDGLGQHYNPGPDESLITSEERPRSRSKLPSRKSSQKLKQRIFEKALNRALQRLSSDDASSSSGTAFRGHGISRKGIQTFSLKEQGTQTLLNPTPPKDSGDAAQENSKVLFSEWEKRYLSKELPEFRIPSPQVNGALEQSGGPAQPIFQNTDVLTNIETSEILKKNKQAADGFQKLKEIIQKQQEREAAALADIENIFPEDDGKKPVNIYVKDGDGAHGTLPAVQHFTPDSNGFSKPVRKVSVAPSPMGYKGFSSTSVHSDLSVHLKHGSPKGANASSPENVLAQRRIRKITKRSKKGSPVSKPPEQIETLPSAVPDENVSEVPSGEPVENVSIVPPNEPVENVPEVPPDEPVENVSILPPDEPVENVSVVPPDKPVENVLSMPPDKPVENSPEAKVAFEDKEEDKIGPDDTSRKEHLSPMSSVANNTPKDPANETIDLTESPTNPEEPKDEENLSSVHENYLETARNILKELSDTSSDQYSEPEQKPPGNRMSRQKSGARLIVSKKRKATKAPEFLSPAPKIRHYDREKVREYIEKQRALRRKKQLEEQQKRIQAQQAKRERLRKLFEYQKKAAKTSMKMKPLQTQKPAAKNQEEPNKVEEVTKQDSVNSLNVEVTSSAAMGPHVAGNEVIVNEQGLQPKVSVTALEKPCTETQPESKDAPVRSEPEQTSQHTAAHGGVSESAAQDSREQQQTSDHSGTDEKGSTELTENSQLPQQGTEFEDYTGTRDETVTEDDSLTGIPSLDEYDNNGQGNAPASKASPLPSKAGLSENAIESMKNGMEASLKAMQELIKQQKASVKISPPEPLTSFEISEELEEGPLENTLEPSQLEEGPLENTLEPSQLEEGPLENVLESSRPEEGPIKNTLEPSRLVEGPLGNTLEPSWEGGKQEKTVEEPKKSRITALMDAYAAKTAEYFNRKEPYLSPVIQHPCESEKPHEEGEKEQDLPQNLNAQKELHPPADRKTNTWKLTDSTVKPDPYNFINTWKRKPLVIQQLQQEIPLNQNGHLSPATEEPGKAASTKEPPDGIVSSYSTDFVSSEALTDASEVPESEEKTSGGTSKTVVTERSRSFSTALSVHAKNGEEVATVSSKISEATDATSSETELFEDENSRDHTPSLHSSAHSGSSEVSDVAEGVVKSGESTDSFASADSSVVDEVQQGNGKKLKSSETVSDVAETVSNSATVTEEGEIPDDLHVDREPENGSVAEEVQEESSIGSNDAQKQSDESKEPEHILEEANKPAASGTSSEESSVQQASHDSTAGTGIQESVGPIEEELTDLTGTSETVKETAGIAANGVADSHKDSTFASSISQDLGTENEDSRNITENTLVEGAQNKSVDVGGSGDNASSFSGLRSSASVDQSSGAVGDGQRIQDATKSSEANKPDAQQNASAAKKSVALLDVPEAVQGRLGTSSTSRPRTNTTQSRESQSNLKPTSVSVRNADGSVSIQTVLDTSAVTKVVAEVASAAAKSAVMAALESRLINLNQVQPLQVRPESLTPSSKKEYSSDFESDNVSPDTSVPKSQPSSSEKSFQKASGSAEESIGEEVDNGSVSHVSDDNNEAESSHRKSTGSSVSTVETDKISIEKMRGGSEEASSLQLNVFMDKTNGSGNFSSPSPASLSDSDLLPSGAPSTPQSSVSLVSDVGGNWNVGAVQEEAFAELTLEMVRRMTYEEQLRAKHQLTLLEFQEKTLIEKARAELKWLELLKKKLQEKGAVDKIPVVRKRQSDLILRLRQERAQLRCMQETYRSVGRKHESLLVEKKKLLTEPTSLAFQLLNGENSVATLSQTGSKGASPSASVHTEVLEEQHSATEDEKSSEVPEAVMSSSSSPGSPVASGSQGTALSKTSHSSYSRHVKSSQSAPVKSSRPDSISSHASQLSSHSLESVLQGIKRLEANKRYLTKREQRLIQRRSHVESLLQWQKKLDSEEKEVKELEKKAVSVLEKSKLQSKYYVSSTPSSARNEAETLGISVEQISPILGNNTDAHHTSVDVSTPSMMHISETESKTGDSVVEEEITRSSVNSPSSKIQEDVPAANDSSAVDTERNRDSSLQKESEIQAEDVTKSQNVSGSTVEEVISARKSTSSIPDKSSSYAESFESANETNGTADATGSLLQANQKISDILKKKPGFLSRNHKRHDSSGSDDSFTVSHSETASDHSDVEGRIYALTEELRQRKAEAEKLRKEQKRRHWEQLKEREVSLKTQLEAYDRYILQTTMELEKQLEAAASTEPAGKLVKPQIKQPHVAKSRHLQKQESIHEDSEKLASGSSSSNGKDVTSFLQERKPHSSSYLAKKLRAIGSKDSAEYVVSREASQTSPAESVSTAKADQPDGSFSASESKQTFSEALEVSQDDQQRSDASRSNDGSAIDISHSSYSSDFVHTSSAHSTEPEDRASDVAATDKELSLENQSSEKSSIEEVLEGTPGTSHSSASLESTLHEPFASLGEDHDGGSPGEGHEPDYSHHSEKEVKEEETHEHKAESESTNQSDQMSFLQRASEEMSLHESHSDTEHFQASLADKMHEEGLHHLSVSEHDSQSLESSGTDTAVQDKDPDHAVYSEHEELGEESSIMSRGYGEESGHSLHAENQENLVQGSLFEKNEGDEDHDDVESAHSSSRSVNESFESASSIEEEIQSGSDECSGSGCCSERSDDEGMKFCHDSLEPLNSGCDAEVSFESRLICQNSEAQLLVEQLSKDCTSVKTEEVSNALLDSLHKDTVACVSNVLKKLKTENTVSLREQLQNCSIVSRESEDINRATDHTTCDDSVTKNTIVDEALDKSVETFNLNDVSQMPSANEPEARSFEFGQDDKPDLFPDKSGNSGSTESENFHFTEFQNADCSEPENFHSSELQCPIPSEPENSQPEALHNSTFIVSESSDLPLLKSCQLPEVELQNSPSLESEIHVEPGNVLHAEQESSFSAPEPLSSCDNSLTKLNSSDTADCQILEGFAENSLPDELQNSAGITELPGIKDTSTSQEDSAKSEPEQVQLENNSSSEASVPMKPQNFLCPEKQDIYDHVLSADPLYHGLQGSHFSELQNFQIHTSVSSDDTSIDDWFEETLSAPTVVPQVELDAQQLVRQYPYYYRQIPNKPPPPYTPPSSPLTYFFTQEAEQISIAQNVYAKLHEVVEESVEAILEGRKQGTPLSEIGPPKKYTDLDNLDLVPKSEMVFHSFVFELVKECALKLYIEQEEKPKPWLKSQNLMFKPLLPGNKDEILPVLLKEVKKSLKLDDDKTSAQNVWSSMKLGRKKRDFVDTVIIDELKEEEAEWVNYDQDEFTVKLQLTDSIFNLLIDDVVTVIRELDSVLQPEQ